MSLYKYTYKIDEHDEEVDILHRNIEVLKQQNKQLEENFNKQQKQIQELLSARE